jgi:hypothetical protein
MLYQPAQDTISPRTQAAVITLGLLTFVTIGVTACIALILGIVYLFVNFVLITLQAILETVSMIAATYAAADPLVKFLLFVLVAYGLYRAYRLFRKRGAAWIKL